MEILPFYSLMQTRELCGNIFKVFLPLLPLELKRKAQQIYGITRAGPIQ